MKGKKRKKYARGTKVTNYVENPQTELMQNDINISKARHESQTDPLLMGLDLLGQLGMQYSSEIGGAIGSMAFGGTTSMVPVNVEGQEVAETPQGELLKFKGPSHEKGGIDVDLPDATEVYSKRISLDGKTMAKRKLEREKRLDKLKMLLEKNPSDQILKNSMERLKTTSASEEEQDTALQNIVSARHEASKKQFAFGGNIDFDEVTGQSKSGFPSTGGNEDILQKLLQTLSGVSQNLDGSGLPSASEGLGLAGTIYSGVSPYLNTLKNRASDTPNESFFKGFGLDALDSIDQQKSFVKEQEDRKLQDLELSRNSALKRNRQVRSINTANALNLATDQGINQAKDQVSDIKFWGDGDTFKLISKASSKKEGWMKSTKAMQIDDVGCVVQVTTQQGDQVAEALTFVPGVKIAELYDSVDNINKVVISRILTSFN